jgi:hypothetical protein
MVLAATVGPAMADTIAVGTVSLQLDFDTNVYFIVISNLTGDPVDGGFAFPPDYPVYTPIRLDNPSITYTTIDSDGALVETTVLLDPLFPGTLDPPDFLFFDGSTVFQSILFLADISPDTFTANSLVYHAADITASALLVNQDGSPLGPFQFADIVVNADPVSVPVSTPEPGTAAAVSVALFLCRLMVPRSRV